MRNAGGQGAMVVPEDGFDEEPTTEQCLAEEREILADSGADYFDDVFCALVSAQGIPWPDIPAKSILFVRTAPRRKSHPQRSLSTWSSTLNRPVKISHPVTRIWKCKP